MPIKGNMHISYLFLNDAIYFALTRDSNFCMLEIPSNEKHKSLSREKTLSLNEAAALVALKILLFIFLVKTKRRIYL